MRHAGLEFAASGGDKEGTSIRKTTRLAVRASAVRHSETRRLVRGNACQHYSMYSSFTGAVIINFYAAVWLSIYGNTPFNSSSYTDE
jgi:hypothetical protein